MVRAVIASITSGGRAARPWLGAGGQAVTADMYQALHLDRPIGVLINSVRSGSPAAAAGLAVGDVVVAVDGREVDDPEALRYRIATKTIGGSVRLSLVRAGREETAIVRLATPPETPPRQSTDIEGPTPFQGATVANVNPALAEEMGIEGAEQGVIVTAVRPGGFAARLDFKIGDRVVKINGLPIRSVDDLLAAVQVRRDKWQLAIDRGGRLLSLTIGG